MGVAAQGAEMEEASRVVVERAVGGNGGGGDGGGDGVGIV